MPQRAPQRQARFSLPIRRNFPKAGLGSRDRFRLWLILGVTPGKTSASKYCRATPYSALIGFVQLIVTGREEESAEVAGLRNRTWNVHLLPADKLAGELQLGHVILADAIVFFVDMNEHALASPPTFPVGIGGQETLMHQVRRLSHSCAMLDGRKWSAVPIVMVLGGITPPYFREEFRLLATQDDAVLVEAATEFQPTVKAIPRGPEAHLSFRSSCASETRVTIWKRSSGKYAR